MLNSNATARFAAALLATFLLIAALGAADIPKADDNAALWYWRCFNELQIDAESSKRHIAILFDEAEPKDESELADLRDRWRSVIATAEVAARKPVCTFGIDRDAGLDAKLPHLEPMRRLAKLIAGEVDAARERNDEEIAARHVDTLCRMSVHVQQDGILISTLVSVAMLNMTCDRVERWLGEHQPTDELRQRFQSSLTQTHAIGPSLLPSVLKHEREMTSQLMLKWWDGPEDFENARTFLQSFGADPIALLSPTDLVKDLQRFDSQMLRLIEAAADQDVERLTRLCKDASELKHGVIAALLIAPIKKSFEQLKSVSERRTALADRLR